MRNLFLFLFVAAGIVSCATAQSREAFDMSLEQYNQLVRWGDFDRAAFFSDASISEGFRERAQAARNVRITDYQLIDVKYDEKALEASAVVSYSYYVITSGIVSQVTDNQKWVYIDEGGVKGWRLKSLLPVFR